MAQNRMFMRSRRTLADRSFAISIGLALCIALVGSAVSQAGTSSIKDRRGDTKICGKKTRTPGLDVRKVSVKNTSSGRISIVIRLRSRASRLYDADLEIKLKGNRKPRYRFTGFNLTGHALMSDSRRPNADRKDVEGYKLSGNRFIYKFDASLIGNPRRFRWRASAVHAYAYTECGDQSGDFAPNRGRPFRLHVMKSAPPSRIRITSGPKGKTSARSPAFRFISPEADTSFQCRLDKRNWKACASPKAYSDLDPGTHIFKVRGTSPNGNLGGPAKRRFKITGKKLTVQTLRVKGRKVSLTLDCKLAKACSGRIAISGKVKKKLLGGGKGMVLIQMIKPTRYSIQAASSKKFRLRLTAAARRALKKTRRLTGTATLTGSNGKKARFKAVIRR